MNTVKNAPFGNHPKFRRHNKVTGCPLTAAVAAIGGKWKLIILYWLSNSPKHFAALQHAMPGISTKVLTQNLRELVSDGLVQRCPTGAAPAPVEYSLTDYGRSVLPLVEGMRQWGGEHLTRIQGPAEVGVARSSPVKDTPTLAATGPSS